MCALIFSTTFPNAKITRQVLVCVLDYIFFLIVLKYLMITLVDKI
jgi:hypothetical protein